MTPPRKVSTENTEMDISVPSVLFPWRNAVTIIVRICHNIIRNSIACSGHICPRQVRPIEQDLLSGTTGKARRFLR
jgi:hypothetical protein